MFVFNTFHHQFAGLLLTIFYQNISSICSLLWDAIFAQLVIVTVILRHLKTISHPPWQNHDQIDWLYSFPSWTSWSSSSMFSHRPALVNAERVWKKILKFVDKNPITGQLRTSLKKWSSIQGSCKKLLQFLPRMQNKWSIFGGPGRWHFTCLGCRGCRSRIQTFSADYVDGSPISIFWTKLGLCPRFFKRKKYCLKFKIA